MVQKASTPWSTRTVAEGGTDSPVGDLVPIPDKITPVVNTGFIATTGKFTGNYSDDLQFTFQDPNQALGAGADMEFSVNMLNHDFMMLAIVDTSGNAINVDLLWSLPTVLTGPYTPFTGLGVNGDDQWKENKTGSALDFILRDTSEALVATWTIYKIVGLRGTQGRILIHNNEGADAGIISTAYMRLLGTPGGRP